MSTELKPDEPCNHVGCLSHTSHPCEGCGRIGGRLVLEESDLANDQFAAHGAPGSSERHEFMRAMMAADVARGEEWMKKPEAERYRPKNSHWDVAWPTYIENWPNDLHSLSIPSTRVKLSMDDARMLGSYILELGEGFERVPENHETLKGFLINELDRICQLYPKGVFVRLGSRSPKDALYWGWGDEKKQPPNGNLTTGKQCFDLLTACSERIYDDLHTQLAMDYAPSIWIREGLDLPEWSEFRCFMRDRHLIGISQYYHRGVFPEVIEDAGGLKWAIEQFFEKQFRDASHLDSVVFDVFVRRLRFSTIKNGVHVEESNPFPGEIANYQVKLLEINPFYYLCDPCLFDWNKPEEFKGQIRFRTELGGHLIGVTDV